LEFNVPFQHKYGYIRDDMDAGDKTPQCPHLSRASNPNNSVILKDDGRRNSMVSKSNEADGWALCRRIYGRSRPVLCPIVFTMNQNINTVLYLSIWHLPNRVRDIASHPHRKQTCSDAAEWPGRQPMLSRHVSSLPIPLSTRRDRRWDARPSAYADSAHAVPSSFSMT